MMKNGVGDVPPDINLGELEVKFVEFEVLADDEYSINFVVKR